MRFQLIGVNHKSAPLEVRERLAIPESRLPDTCRDLTAYPGIEEGMVISTCNRVEIVAHTTNGHADLRGFLHDYFHLTAAELDAHLYEFREKDAVRHLFRVASSLDSMVVGEPQILGQLKNAYALAKEHGALSGFLDLVMTRAFNVAKRVRSETDIGENAVSISYAAVELARDIFGSLNGKRVLVIGAGEMAESALRHLRRAGVSEILIANRTRERAQPLADEFNGRVVDYESLTDALPDVDILLASSGAPHYIVTRDQMKVVIARRKNRPMFLIDIAVPRNIEPEVNDLDNVFLYDIDDLDKTVKSNIEGRKETALEAEEIIREEVERMMQRLKTREVAPTIVSLQEQLESVRAHEIDRMRSRLGQMTPQQEEAIEAITRGIINKIAHGPITELRRSASNPDGAHLSDLIRRLFRLEHK